MKNLLIILLFISFKSFSQSDSLVWETGTEKFVINYQVQQGIDTNHWINLAKVQPLKKDSNWYAYALPAPNYFYRIVSNMPSSSIATSPDLLTSVLPVTITNYAVIPSEKYVTVTWISQNENNLKGYEIDRSWDAITFENVATVAAKGNSTYDVQIQRPVTTKSKGWWFWKKTITTIDSRKAFYKIISVDNDGGKNSLIIING